ncbi:MFS transporter [Limosilactobacillus mucosae]|uniref:MFS transporter n=1 Tax=Limosilactobacillus mucosae TaxID=97478 RepID=UPI003993467E
MKDDLFKWLGGLAFLNNVGYSCVWPVTTIYMHNQLHQSLVLAGVVLLCYSSANVIGSIAAGSRFDRGHTFGLNLFGQLIALLAVTLLIFMHGWPSYPILLCIFGFGNGWILTLINSMGTRVKKYPSVKVFNQLYLAENIGLVVGTGLTGFIYEQGIGWLFVLIAGIYLVSLIIVGIKFAEVELHGECPVRQTVDALADLTGKRNLFVIIVLLLGLVVVWVMYEQWMSNLAVYLARFGISTGRYGMLWTINGVLIIIFQLLLDWIGRYHATLDLQVILGSFFMAGSFMLLLFAAHYGQFVLAMVVLTLGESLLIPGVPAYVNRLSPVVQKGRGQGMVNAFSSLGKALGPLFGGLVIERLGYFKLFAVCTVADLIVGMMIGIVLLILRRGLQTYD